MTVKVECEEEPGEKAVTRRQVSHPLHVRKSRVDQCGRRVRLEELFAAYNACATGDKGQFVKEPRALVVAATCYVI